MKDLPLTVGFGNDQIGWIKFTTNIPEAALVQMVFAPAYIKNDDGTIELIEFSLIPAGNAVSLINRGIEDAEKEGIDSRLDEPPEPVVI